MENKKLLHYLLNDLTEIDSILNDRTDNCFDEMEMEFFRNRVKGAQKLIQMFINQEISEPVLAHHSAKIQVVQEPDSIKSEPKTIAPEVLVSPPIPVTEIASSEPLKAVVPEQAKYHEPVKPEPIEADKPIEKDLQKTVLKEPDTDLNIPLKEDSEERVFGKLASAMENTFESIAADENKPEAPKPTVEKTMQAAVQQELKLDDEIPNEQNKRLGDSFTKEKSVNDLRSEDSKLEHKLSNMPLTNLQAAIGINDRFQYVRELFDGKPELYAKTVNDLDEMDNLKDAVAYLQNNFKWKKTDTSLKFVNLIKRRFPNE